MSSGNAVLGIHQEIAGIRAASAPPASPPAALTARAAEKAREVFSGKILLIDVVGLPDDGQSGVAFEDVDIAPGPV